MTVALLFSMKLFAVALWIPRGMGLFLTIFSADLLPCRKDLWIQLIMEEAGLLSHWKRRLSLLYFLRQSCTLFSSASLCFYIHCCKNSILKLHKIAFRYNYPQFLTCLLCSDLNSYFNLTLLVFDSDKPLPRIFSHELFFTVIFKRGSERKRHLPIQKCYNFHMPRFTYFVGLCQFAQWLYTAQFLWLEQGISLIWIRSLELWRLEEEDGLECFDVYRWSLILENISTFWIPNFLACILIELFHFCPAVVRQQPPMDRKLQKQYIRIWWFNRKQSGKSHNFLLLGMILSYIAGETGFADCSHLILGAFKNAI